MPRPALCRTGTEKCTFRLPRLTVSNGPPPKLPNAGAPVATWHVATAAVKTQARQLFARKLFIIVSPVSHWNGELNVASQNGKELPVWADYVVYLYFHPLRSFCAKELQFR